MRVITRYCSLRVYSYLKREREKRIREGGGAFLYDGIDGAVGCAGSVECETTRGAVRGEGLSVVHLNLAGYSRCICYIET